MNTAATSTSNHRTMGRPRPPTQSTSLKSSTSTQAEQRATSSAREQPSSGPSSRLVTNQHLHTDSGKHMHTGHHKPQTQTGHTDCTIHQQIPPARLSGNIHIMSPDIPLLQVSIGHQAAVGPPGQHLICKGAMHPLTAPTRCAQGTQGCQGIWTEKPAGKRQAVHDGRTDSTHCLHRKPTREVGAACGSAQQALLPNNGVGRTSQWPQQAQDAMQETPNPTQQAEYRGSATPKGIARHTGITRQRLANASPDQADCQTADSCMGRTHPTSAATLQQSLRRP